MTLKQIILWYTLKGDVDTHAWFGYGGKRKTKLWFFKATIDNKTIMFNYLKYDERIVLYHGAHVEIDAFTDNIQSIRCRTVKELKEAIK